ncbi:unnamed protein product [Boreogadus saida]
MPVSARGAWGGAAPSLMDYTQLLLLQSRILGSLPPAVRRGDGADSIRQKHTAAHTCSLFSSEDSSSLTGPLQMCRGMLVQLKLSQASDNTVFHSEGDSAHIGSAHAGICPGRTPPTPDSANVGLFVSCIDKEPRLPATLLTRDWPVD